MEKAILEVRMFGEFSLSLGENCLNDKSDRSKKLWLLLAYLISNRRRAVAQDELFDLLWGRDSDASSGALKTTVHRLRLLLDKLYPGAGHSLITQEAGSYRWEELFEVRTDADSFENLCREAAAERDSERRCTALCKAAAIYRGAFLERLSSEAWVAPLAAHYHNLYIKAVTEALPLLRGSGRLDEAMALAEKAIAIEPYQEHFYRCLMEYLIEAGRQKPAVTVYEKLRRLMLDEFGVIPEEATRRLYYSAVHSINKRLIPADFIRGQLCESSPSADCMVCEYDFFKLLYRAEARAITHNGSCIHISLITLTGENGEELPSRSLDRAMADLEELILTSLRKGDIISRCSTSQFVMMLPQANYENSRMVSERIIRAFSRRYPHSPARLDYSVWPLEPSK